MIRDIRALGPMLKLLAADHCRLLIGGAALSAAAALSGILLLGLSGWFITATALAGLSAATALAFDVFAPAAGIRLLALTRTAARYGERLVTHDATLRVLTALRERLFRGWAEPGSAHRLAMRPARTLFRLTLDLGAMDAIYLSILVPVAAALCGVLLAVVALGAMDIRFGLAFGTVLTVAGLALPLLVARTVRRPMRRRTHAMEILRARVIDLVSGQRDLAMAGQLDTQLGAIAKADRRLLAADDAVNRIELGTGISFGILSAVLLAATLIAVALLAQSGVIGAPVAVLGLLLALGVVEPFAALRRGAIDFGRSVLAARRLNPRLVPRPAAPSVAAPPDHGIAVQLRDVSCGYPASPAPVLRNVSLTLREGERVAVIGRSGAGKSTLLALIAGDVAAWSGEVRTQRATLFTQRTELFQDSLRDNLRLADPAVTDERLLAALAAAGLGADVAALPAGLATRLGEGGLGLSGGQARRLALARLLLNESALWLLDEPTEGLDRETARDVIGRMLAQAQGRTLIVATHIRRDAEIADRLLIMDRGRVTDIRQRGEPGFKAALASLRPD